MCVKTKCVLKIEIKCVSKHANIVKLLLLLDKKKKSENLMSVKITFV